MGLFLVYILYYSFFAFSALRNTKVFCSREAAAGTINALKIEGNKNYDRFEIHMHVYAIQNFVHVADLFATGKIRTLTASQFDVNVMSFVRFYHSESQGKITPSNARICLAIAEFD